MTEYLSDEEQKAISLKAQIDVMSHEELARKWRFAPVGDPMLQGEVGDYFAERFKKFGGMTPEISKKLGW